jgi:hypothetical protein
LLDASSVGFPQCGMAAIEKLNMLLDMTASRILMKRAVGKFFGRP